MGIGPAKLASHASRTVRIMPHGLYRSFCGSVRLGVSDRRLFEDHVARESPLDGSDEAQNRLLLIFLDDHSAISQRMDVSGYRLDDQVDRWVLGPFVRDGVGVDAFAHIVVHHQDKATPLILLTRLL